VYLGHKMSSLFGEELLSAPIHSPPLWSPNRSFIRGKNGILETSKAVGWSRGVVILWACGRIDGLSPEIGEVRGGAEVWSSVDGVYAYQTSIGLASRQVLYRNQGTLLPSSVNPRY
jgi:hypothetical protein